MFNLNLKTVISLSGEGKPWIPRAFYIEWIDKKWEIVVISPTWN